MRAISWTLLVASGLLGLGMHLVSADEPEAGAAAARDAVGDPLPAGAWARLGTMRLRHGNHVSSLSFTGDSKFLVSAGGDKTVRLWDAASGRELRRFDIGPDFELPSAAVSPHGKTLAIASQGAIRLWDLAGGAELPALDNADGPLGGIAFAPDSRTAAVAQSTCLTLWDLDARKEIRKLKTLAGTTSPPAFSADGKLVAVGDGNCVRIWDVATGSQVQRLRRHSSFICSISFSPDGKRLASASADNAIRLWDVATGEARGHLAHPNTRASTSHFLFENNLEIALVAFAPDGRTLYSCAKDDRLIRAWDAVSGKLLREFEGHAAGSLCLAVSPDGRTLAAGAGDSTIRLWDTASGQQRLPGTGHQGRVYHLCWASDGRSILSAGRDNTIRVWDSASGRERRRFGPDTDQIGFVAFSADGRWLAAARPDDESIQLWDAAAGKVARELTCEDQGILGVALSDSGKLLAAINQQDGVTLFDIQTGKLLRQWKAQPGDNANNNVFIGGGNGFPRTPIAFNADASQLATAGRTISNRSMIHFWETATGKLVRSIPVEGQGVFLKLAVAADGCTLALAAQEHILILSAATGQVLARLENAGLFHPQGMVNYESMLFSPDGKLLAAAGQDSKVLVWEAATGRQVREIDTRQGWVSALAFSPDGRTLAVGGLDTTVLLCDLTGLRGSPMTQELTAKEIEEQWQALTGEAGPAYSAIWKLARVPAQVVPFLRQRVTPTASPEPRQLDRLLDELDSDDFGARQKATEELERLGELAEDALRKRLVAAPSLEARRRIELLVQRLEMPLLTAEKLRAIRAIAILEQAATPAARHHLTDLAAGLPGTRLTQEAKAALRRLEKARP